MVFCFRVHPDKESLIKKEMKEKKTIEWAWDEAGFSEKGGKLRQSESRSAVLLPDSALASNQNALILFFAWAEA